MKLITERLLVQDVADQWRHQYQGERDGQWSDIFGGSSKDIWLKLKALDVQTATAKDVAEIIGNDGWCGPRNCHECGLSSSVTVEIGQPPDYESHTAEICGDCLAKAADLARSALT